MKYERQLRQRVTIFLICALMVGLVSPALNMVDTIQYAYAASGAYQSKTCPHGGSCQDIGDACCYGCGTTGRGEVNITDPYARSCGYTESSSNVGTGYTSETSTPDSEGKYTITYYRCYNCFVTSRNTDVIKTEYYIKDASGKSGADTSYGNGTGVVEGPYYASWTNNSSKGDVPVRWCSSSECGPKGAGYIITGRNTYHFPKKYSFSVSAGTGGSASVSGGGSSGSYEKGASVNVSATTDNGYTFDGWYDGSTRKSTSESYSFNMPAKNYSLTAKFTKKEAQKYSLSASASPSNGGTVEGSSGSLEAGTSVSVTAVPKSGYIFKSWSSSWSGFSGSSASASFSMPSQSVSLTANFEKISTDKYTVTYVDEFYTGSKYDGQGNGNSYTYDKGHIVSFDTPSTNNYSFNGVRGYHCTGVSVSPTDAGVSASGTMISGTLNGSIVVTRTMVREAPAEPDPDTPSGGGGTDGGGTEGGGDEGGGDETPVVEEYYVSVSASPSYGGTVSGGGTYKVGDDVFLSADENDGYDFDGWSDDNWFTMPAHDVDVTAYFSEKGPNTVAYYPNYPSSSTRKAPYTKYESTDSYWDDDHYAASNSFELPTGYRSFKAWNTKSNGTGTAYSEGAYISYTGRFFSLYAQWGDPITYVVQFADDDIETKPTPTLSEQQTWVFDSPEAMPEALPEKVRTVTYDTNKKSTMSTTPAFKSQVTDVNTKAVFNFFGWKPYHYADGVYVPTGMDAVGPLKEQNLSSVQDDRIILFPEWGGDSSYVTLPIVTCTGYKFYGWTFDKNETDVSKALVAEPSGQKYQSREDCTLYALWMPKTYPVVLDFQHPELHHTETITMTFDADGPDVAVPKRLHYTFQGYYTQPDGKGVKYYDKEGHSTKLWRIDDNSVTTLYAYWVLDTQIIYDRNSGLGYMGDTWLDDNATSVTLSKNLFTKAGYTFSKWTLKKDGSGTSYNNEATISGIPVSSVITLYAQWEPNQYTVTFNPNGGTVSPTSKSVTYSKTYGTLPTPTKTGYTFVDWYTSDTNILTKSGTTVTRMDSHELVAMWKANSYTVTFDWNFDFERTGVDTKTGWDGNTKSVTYGSTYGSLPAPSKEGYTFLGWYTSETSENGDGTAVTASTVVTVTSKQTLYAKWINNDYLLVFDYNLDYKVDPNN